MASNSDGVSGPSAPLASVASRYSSRSACWTEPPNTVGIHDGEEHVVDADAERQDNDGANRERGLLPQQAKREPEILRDIVHDAGAACVPAVLLDLVEPAEFEAGLAPRFVGRLAGAHLLGDDFVEVKSQFVVQLAFQPVAPPDAIPPGHDASPSAMAKNNRIASDRRAQFCVCAFSCTRPLGVIR